MVMVMLLGGSVVLSSKLKRQRSLVLLASMVGAATLTGCGVLKTQVDPDFEQQFYIGAGLLASNLKPDTSDVTSVSVDDSESSGISATFGYDISNRLSVEGHVAELGEATMSPSGSIGYSVAGVSGIVYGLNDTVDRNRRIGFSVFGKLGVGAMANTADTVEYRRVNDAHLLAGVGLEYGLDNGIGLRAELIAHEADAKYAQLAMIYRFGESSNARSRSAQPSAEMSNKQLPTAAASEYSGVTRSNQPRKSLTISPLVGADLDKDGVPNTTDQCPNSKADSPVKADGCEVFDGVIEGINFKVGSETLTNTAARILSDVATTLHNYPDVRVAIEAHTDNLGEATHNLQLSKRRAIAVASYLVQQGISGSRLKPQAYGESKPRSTNQSVSGRASNRRVEFSILQ